VAWLAGFCQATSSISVEIVNLAVLCAANSILDVVFNFIALNSVACFDNFVYDSLKNEPLKKLFL
jgi:hypothetical protein